jgi:arylsulfatase A-like enzyme
MTGRLSMRLGLGYTVIRPWSNFGVPLEERFLPQAFHDAGYQTAITGKWHLGHGDARFLPHSRGFDHAYGHVNGAIDYFTHEREGGLDWHRNGKSVVEEGYSTNLLGDEAVRFIERRDKSRPFLLYVPFNAPHSPLQAPPDVLSRFAGIEDPKRRAYTAMVHVLDEQIGRILATLDREKLSSDTIVLFFSDNGGPTGLGATNIPLRGAKATTFEGGIRVPAVIRWTGVLKPGVSQQVLYTADYFPTLAAAAGIKPGNKLPFDGKNLWPELKSGKRQNREDLFFSVESGGLLRYAVLRREWKLVREVNSRTNEATNYLFRIEEDPSEKNNLAGREPKLVAELISVVDRWRALHPADGQRNTGAPPKNWKAPRRWAEAAGNQSTGR